MTPTRTSCAGWAPPREKRGFRFGGAARLPAILADFSKGL